MKLKHIFILAMGALALTMATSCDKVSPAGVLLGNSGVDDRVKMSATYYNSVSKDGNYRNYELVFTGEHDYSFLVGSDSHMQNDSSRMAEMCDIALENGDLLMCHLGDIADTKAEYYVRLKRTLFAATIKRMQSWGCRFFTNDDGSVFYDEDYNAYYQLPVDEVYDDAPYDEVKELKFANFDVKENLRFFPVVGNHDITHNGWSLWSNIFGSTFYELYVCALDESDNFIWDHFIFLDTANGTLGAQQVDYINELIGHTVVSDLELGEVRNTFVFTHSNLFRPEAVQFASTFPREEHYFLLNKFKEWNADIVFMGHVHKWDEREFGGVQYLILDAMSETNNPDPGDYLVRVRCKLDGDISYERVRMNTTKKK